MPIILYYHSSAWIPSGTVFGDLMQAGKFHRRRTRTFFLCEPYRISPLHVPVRFIPIYLYVPLYARICISRVIRLYSAVWQFFRSRPILVSKTARLEPLRNVRALHNVVVHRVGQGALGPSNGQSRSGRSTTYYYNMCTVASVYNIIRHPVNCRRRVVKMKKNK